MDTGENKRAVGTLYEKQACEYLKNKGYKILICNYRCKCGEIDIIAEDGAYLVFCEVKYRKTGKKGNPLEAVTLSKQRTISKCAMMYMLSHGLTEVPCRFDVVGILGDEITLLKNAFEMTGV